MVIHWRDSAKLFGINIIACCAVFVCTLFLNYNLDLVPLENRLTSEAAITMYQAIVSAGKVIAAVTGGCLVVTSAIMLLFYVKSYIDTHGRELGILKAMGYSNWKIAANFWVFGLSVLVGAALGYGAALLYLPSFYGAQNDGGLFPGLEVQFHPLLPVFLVVVPTLVFSALSVGYACFKLKTPVLDLLRERREYKTKIGKANKKDVAFLEDLSSTTRKSKKSLVFFVGFSAFCFSAMVQMSMSMEALASETFGWMILLIGLILAFITLLLSLSNVVRGNTKTIAMMRVFGYDHRTCSRAILGAYRPVACIGFVLGTAYQYGLLKVMVSLVFAGVEPMPEYHFDWKGLAITLAAFVVVYQLFLFLFSRKMQKTSLRSIMAE